jgi:Delta7-sterol 5-desaturase
MFYFVLTPVLRVSRVPSVSEIWANIRWTQFTLCLVGAISVGLIIFYLAAAYYHFKYYIRRREDFETWKCQTDRWLKPEQQREAIIRSSINLTIGGINTGILVYAMTQGWETPIYMDVSEYGWAYTIFSALALFVFIDAGAYYAHRMFHFRFFYRRYHKIHHRFVSTSPFVTTAVHPFEFLVLQFVSFLPMAFMPVHGVCAALVLTYVLIFNIIDHSGVSLKSSLPWQGPSNYHDDHHRHFHCNFGQHLMIFDRFHGTLRRQERTYGVEVFGGKGAGDDSKLAPFVEY